MRIQLPNGLLDGSDLFNYAVVDELYGKQQNYLANRELVHGNIGHVPKILEDLVLSLETEQGLKWNGHTKDAIWKLPVGDLEVLLIKIRQKTYGEIFYFDAECTHCQHMNKQKIELDSLELDVLSVEEMLDKSKTVFLLPKENKEVEVKPLYLKDLFETLKTFKGAQEDLVTATIALHVKRLGDKSKVTSKDIENIKLSDITFLSEQIEKTKLEGTIDTEMEITCNKCNKDFEAKLNVFGADFFFHSKGSTN